MKRATQDTFRSIATQTDLFVDRVGDALTLTHDTKRFHLTPGQKMRLSRWLQKHCSEGDMICLRWTVICEAVDESYDLGNERGAVHCTGWRVASISYPSVRVISDAGETEHNPTDPEDAAMFESFFPHQDYEAVCA